jgi:3-hydroxybutyryl-CoA dehydrogenase
VPERIEIKKKVFQELDRLLPAAGILATNSSGLCVSDIAAGTKRPQLCIGTHFLNPPFLMPLVEVVKGRETADTTVSLVMDLLTALGKHPVLVRRDVPGYVLNRLQAAVFRELISLLESDVMSVPDLEATVRYGFGLRLPIIKVFELVDLVGLDTIQAVFTYLFPTLDTSASPPRLISEMVQRGELGVKSGKGFHDYNQPGVLESLQKKEVAIGQMVAMMTRFD